MSCDQNELLKAVNNSGAVSPEMRATAKSTPVMMPERAARHVTARITLLRGAPIDAPASRKPFGTRRSMFSVVRTTTGMTMMANAIEPAQPEK